MFSISFLFKKSKTYDQTDTTAVVDGQILINCATKNFFNLYAFIKPLFANIDLWYPENKLNKILTHTHEFKT